MFTRLPHVNPERKDTAVTEAIMTLETALNVYEKGLNLPPTQHDIMKLYKTYSKKLA